MFACNGMHIENIDCDEASKQQRDRIVGHTGCVTMLHLQAPREYPRIRSVLGKGVLVHVRMYLPNWFSVSPEEWANRSMDMLSGIPNLLDDPRVVVTPMNEPDLVHEGHPDAAVSSVPISRKVYEDAWGWALRWTIRAKTLVPRLQVLTPPLAGGHDMVGYGPDEEYRLPEFADLVQLCGMLAIHSYCAQPTWGHTMETGKWSGLRHLRPPSDKDVGGVCMQYPDVPYMVTELGNGNHHDVSRAGQTVNQFNALYKANSDTGRCLGITPFIWDSGPEHANNVICKNLPLVNGLADLPRYPAAALPEPISHTPPPLDLAETYPEQYAEWVDSGGIAAHFRPHLLAITTNLACTEDDLHLIINNIKASVTQLEILIARLLGEEAQK